MKATVLLCWTLHIATLSCALLPVVEAWGVQSASLTTTTTATTSSTRLFARQQATFGMGCFWKPAEELSKVEGVLETLAGYTGNPTAKADNKPPTYDQVCFSRDWVEGVRVDYDDSVLSYEDLLEAFFQAQEPKLGSRQYASIIFPHNEDQQQVAQHWLAQHTTQPETERVRDDGVPLSITTLEPLSAFYKAEGYHQNYWPKFRQRAAAVVGLIVLQMLPLDTYLAVPQDAVLTIHTVADWSLKVIAVAILAERFLDAKVEQL